MYTNKGVKKFTCELIDGPFLFILAEYFRSFTISRMLCGNRVGPAWFL